MNTAEKNRLNITSEPPMTVERFERILPFAIALGVEKPWSEHFEGELARNAVADAQFGYQPRFYSGRYWSSSSGGFSSRQRHERRDVAGRLLRLRLRRPPRR